MESEKINNIILKIKYKGKEEEYFCDETALFLNGLMEREYTDISINW